ncbi:3,5-dihydroxyphenylacetyl-CoA synthase DpgA [Massilia putida]|uniref:3,5-dihydroxyphenylacetyl-CoA synthase DpgA n=1 Tax=Massilia putida TaxID=1141883 RepID=UPI000952D06E|nr:3,5-dihydroxyphenylacetyl-CoA synthase DpgA [Massilia putida]
MTNVLSAPRVLSIATTNPGQAYTNDQLIDLFDVTDSKLVRLFRNSRISKRYLDLPQARPNGRIEAESSAELAAKHKRGAVAAGVEATRRALETAGLRPDDLDYIACVTSTGFLCPGLSAYVAKELGLRPDVHRLDVVGMGCSAGLNGMQPLVNYCRLNPSRHAALVCVEICSASYVFDGTIRTAVVNSLFGDGAVAAIFGPRGESAPVGPEVLDFRSHVITDHIDAMRFDHVDGKYSFYLDRDIPYVIGANVRYPIEGLLSRHNLRIRDIAHWIIHSGGRKVIDSIKFNLGLSSHALRHTESVLAEMGNVSSGSFLFSHRRLLEEQVTAPGDYTVMMTMGPGASIECCLARF